MKKRRIGWAIPAMALALMWFGLSVESLRGGRQAEGRQLLEDALRRTAVACYAAEGFYPPDVAYMEEHYRLEYDRDSYVIHYELFASNLMPDITVLEK